MSPAPGPAKTILIVEDEEAIRKLLIRHLKPIGMEAIGLPSGNDALRWCEENGLPDLVVSDVLMPLMSGPELYNRLIARYGKVPFLFMTGHAGDDFYEEPIEAPVLPKPFNREQLLDAVRSVLGDNNQGDSR
ncbi:MAG: response regulator [Pseudomonadales bacterium]|nr:response regulator [Pseudomonadales bacterium]